LNSQLKGLLTPIADSIKNRQSAIKNLIACEPLEHQGPASSRASRVELRLQLLHQKQSRLYHFHLQEL
jgi:hypothetical protein